MSAIELSHDHINAMMQIARGDALRRSYYYKGESYNILTDETGQALLDQNIASVNYRYNDNIEPESFRYDPFQRSYTVVEILKACKSYIYQSCETPDWEKTQAFVIVNVLIDECIDRLPGYDEANTWTINC